MILCGFNLYSINKIVAHCEPTVSQIHFGQERISFQITGKKKSCPGEQETYKVGTNCEQSKSQNNTCKNFNFIIDNIIYNIL